MSNGVSRQVCLASLYSLEFLQKFLFILAFFFKKMPQICGKGEIFIIDNLLKATFETEESGQKMITDILRFYSDGPITFGELSHVKP